MYAIQRSNDGIGSDFCCMRAICFQEYMQIVLHLKIEVPPLFLDIVCLFYVHYVLLLFLVWPLPGTVQRCVVMVEKNPIFFVLSLEPLCGRFLRL